MDYEPALQRIGVQVTKKKIGESSLTLYFRIDPKSGDKWVDTVTAFLLGAQGRPYKVDLSKYFYADKATVKYQWRLIVTGENAPALLVLLAQCALETSVAHAPQLTSFPLVGRIDYEFNPAKGKLKGAHDQEDGDRIVSVAMGGGMLGGAA
jgi:hypothetical protein